MWGHAVLGWSKGATVPHQGKDGLLLDHEHTELTLSPSTPRRERAKETWRARSDLQPTTLSSYPFRAALFADPASGEQPPL